MRFVHLRCEIWQIAVFRRAYCAFSVTIAGFELTAPTLRVRTLNNCTMAPTILHYIFLKMRLLAFLD